ncbi:MAG TPA: cytochrome P450 [Pseudonocardiaceae bacterium]|nr:cytochrome P450 [Pseudonocardiaceae bacterium]
MTGQCPFVLDVDGGDIQGEGVKLRGSGPATLIEMPGGVRGWAVTSADMLRSLLTDPRVSKDPRQHWPAWINGEIAADWPLAIWVSVQNMFTAYGTEHRRLRSLVAAAFTARRTQAMRPTVEAITATLLDAVEQQGADGQPVDLRAMFAYPLPVGVICHLFGLPEDERPAMRQVVDTVFDTTATPEQAQANGIALYGILTRLVASKRATPGDDLTSALIAAHDDDGAALNETELIDTLILLLSAGHETTVNLLDQAITALLTHPDQLRLVRSGERTWGDVIEETLRWQAPVAYLPLRYAVEDIDMMGVRIPQGDPILAAYAASGRDQTRYGDTADDFDITRANKQHYAFGHGVHHCLGAPLARTEAEIALSTLFTRFPNLTFAVPAAELTPMHSFLSNGHESLPVRTH